MNRVNIRCSGSAWQIEINIPEQKFVVLKYGNLNGPLANYLPIKILPLDEDGFAAYDFSCEMMIPEDATHIWISLEMSEDYVLSVPIPNKPVFTREKLQYVFYAISDIHTISKGGKQLKFQTEAFRHIAKANLAFVIMAGDIANGVQAKEYAICTKQICNHFSDIPILTTFGNHDFHANHSQDVVDDKSRGDFQDWIGERNRLYGVSCNYFDAYNYSTSINGIHIVSMQGMDYKNKIYTVGDRVLSWLDNILAAHAGERQIVFSHYPLTENNGRIYLRENSKLKEILTRHGNVLYFAGHTHDALDSDVESIRKIRNVTYVNTGSVGNTEPCVQNVKILKQFRDKMIFPQLEEYFCRRSTGIRAEVYESYVILRGVDFMQDKYIPRCMAMIRNEEN